MLAYRDYINLISLLFVLGVIIYVVYTLLFSNQILSQGGDDEETRLVGN